MVSLIKISISSFVASIIDFRFFFRFSISTFIHFLEQSRINSSIIFFLFESINKVRIRVRFRVFSIKKRLRISSLTDSVTTWLISCSSRTLISHMIRLYAKEILDSDWSKSKSWILIGQNRNPGFWLARIEILDSDWPDLKFRILIGHNRNPELWLARIEILP